MNGAPSSMVSPGLWGFFAFFLLGLALYLLMRNMNARMRRMSYRSEELAREAEQELAQQERPDRPREEQPDRPREAQPDRTGEQQDRVADGDRRDGQAEEPMP